MHTSFNQCRDICIVAGKHRRAISDKLLIKFQTFANEMRNEFTQIFHEIEKTKKLNHGIHFFIPKWIKNENYCEYGVCVFDADKAERCDIGDYSGNKCYGYVYNESDEFPFSYGHIELDENFFDIEKRQELKTKLIAEFHDKINGYVNKQKTQTVNDRKEKIKQLEAELAELKRNDNE